MKESIFVKNLIGILTAAAAVLIVLFCTGVPAFADETETIEGTVYIEDICVNGMTLEEAQAAMQKKFDEFAASEITIDVRGNPQTVKAADLGLNYTNPDLPSYLIKLQNRGNIWQRYKMERYVSDRGGLVYSLDLQVNEENVRNTVTALCSPLDIQRVDMQIQRDESGAFIPTEKIDGVYTDVDTTTANICHFMNEEWHGGPGTVNAVITVDEASGDPDAVSQMNSIIGSGVTEFVIDEKNQFRNTNIAVSTAKVNGSIVYPGEEFSTITPMMPFTEEEGYVQAPAYEQGQVVDDIGGGICQVSTTLYRAVLEAELEVTERNQHSMIVGYVEPSMDATVSEGEKDFKFVNTTDAPIYIEGMIEDNKVIFNIYGHETRPEGREVAFESEVISREPFQMEYKPDPTLEFGSIRYTDGHDAVDAVAYKLVYMNGQLESRDLLTHSDYQLGNAIGYFGTMGASDAAVAAITQACETNNQDAVIEAVVSNGGTIKVVP